MVRLLLGTKWLIVIPLLPWILALGCTAAIVQTLYRLLLGHGQQRHCLYLDSIALLGVFMALVLLLPGGLISYVQGVIVVQLIGIAISSYWLARCGGIAVGSLRDVFVAPIVPIGAAWIVCVQVGAVSEGTFPLLVQMVVQIVSYLAMYILLIRLLFARQVMEIVLYLPLERSVRRLLALG